MISPTDAIHSGHSACYRTVVLADDLVELALIALAAGRHDLLAAGLCEVTRLKVEVCPVLAVGDPPEIVGTDNSSREGTNVSRR